MLGKNAKLYYNTATFGTPTWVEILKARAVKWSLKWNRAKSATRGSLIQRGGKTDGEVPVSFTVEQDLTDAPVLAVRAAIISPTAVFDMMVLNAGSAVNGAFGVRGEFDLFSLDDDQGLQNTLAYDVGAEPSATANPLQTVLVAAGAPVFTTLAA
jgi:hypothetical protein